MSEYLRAVLWGGFLILSMTGFGCLLWRLLRMQGPGTWSLHACLGLAFSTSVGGLLNLFSAISRPTVFAYLIIGSLILGARLARSRRLPGQFEGIRASRVAVAGLLLAGTLLTVRLAGTVAVRPPAAAMYPGSFNAADDLHAYFIYPETTIQTGAMGADLFSMHRTPSHSLGGAARTTSAIVGGRRKIEAL
jgi:hypothetical protein